MSDVGIERGQPKVLIGLWVTVKPRLNWFLSPLALQKTETLHTTWRYSGTTVFGYPDRKSMRDHNCHWRRSHYAVVPSLGPGVNILAIFANANIL